MRYVMGMSRNSRRKGHAAEVPEAEPDNYMGEPEKETGRNHCGRAERYRKAGKPLQEQRIFLKKKMISPTLTHRQSGKHLEKAGIVDGQLVDENALRMIRLSVRSWAMWNR